MTTTTTEPKVYRVEEEAMRNPPPDLIKGIQNRLLHIAYREVLKGLMERGGRWTFEAAMGEEPEEEGRVRLWCELRFEKAAEKEVIDG
jgi:hypothetical protein